MGAALLLALSNLTWEHEDSHTHDSRLIYLCKGTGSVRCVDLWLLTPTCLA
jgi:hypothetical protein